MFGNTFGSEPATPSDVDKFRADVKNGITQLEQLVNAIRAPVPTQTGDGSQLVVKPDSPELIQRINDTLSDIRHLGMTGIETLIQVAEKGKTGDPWNDKSYLMEKLIRTAAELPANSPTGKRLTDGFLTKLWNDLQHPPTSYLGEQYKYRSADGSFNSLLHPDLGKQGTPYARSVAPRTMQPGAMPDPGVVFDSVMTRKHREPHPNNISSMLFYVASLIIHDLFRTNHRDFTISDTSSYLDLAPLYGSNQSEQDKMRTGKDGKIHPDCFSEVRLLMFPPGAGALLILFNRFHNYACDQLASINDGGRFNKPAGDPSDGKNVAAWKKYDNDLFQTARLVTCGLYINIILVDYVRTILNVNKTPSDWALDPRENINDLPVATGNQVSCEFNLVYRWHSTISDRDEKWTEEMWKAAFGANPETMDFHEFIAKATQMEDDLQKKLPYERQFANLKRQHDLTFRDEDLAEILTASIEDVANSYGANRVPRVMRVIEILGIQQARAWNVASLNEFRKYFNLTPHQTFSDINSDPYVADQLMRLYETPDQVELYVGLVTEEAKKPKVPGAGLTPGFTTSRAVLSDAVATVRGDRFYTLDYTPRNLTNWGFAEVNPDTTIDHGCVFYKLFLRGLPTYFKPNSVYAHYPLTIPTEMHRVLGALGTADKYDFERPAKIPDSTMVFSYDAVKEVATNQDVFKVTWGSAIEFLMGPAAKDFMLSGDGPANAKSRQMMQNALYIEGRWDREVKAYYEMITEQLLKQKSYKLGNGVNEVDIIRDVGNLAHVHFCADLFLLPLKTEARPLGIFTEHELYLMMSAVFICVFFDLDPAESFPLRQKSHQAVQALGLLVEKNVAAIKATGKFSNLFATIFEKPTPLKEYGVHLIHRLLDNKTDPMDVKSLVWGHIMGTAGGMTANQGQLFAQILDYYINGPGNVHLAAIQSLAKQDTDEAFGTLMRYVLEGGRINGETGVFRRCDKPITIKDLGRDLEFKKGDKVMANFRSASHDPKAFPAPEKVVLDRPIESYIHLGMGAHECLGSRMNRVALTAMLKVIGRLEGLRAARGEQGKVKKVLRPFPGAEDNAPEDWHFHAFMTTKWDQFWPFPQNLKVNWD